MSEMPTVDFQAGGTNLHYGRIAHWLAASLTTRLPDHVVNIKVGVPYRTIAAVGTGLAQVGVTTPAVAARQCLHGQATFDRPHPELRSIGVVPHRDALVLGVAPELNVTSIEEIRERQIPLRLVAPRGQESLGFGCCRVMEAYGITPEFLAQCGGEWLDIANAQVGWKIVADGKADAFLQESVAMAFRPLARVRPIRLLSLREDVLQDLESEYGYSRKAIPAGTIAGQEQPVFALNWDHWIVVAHASLSDEVAYALADAFLTNRAALERQYTADDRLPADEHPLDYPIRPDVVANEVTVPLHPGAAARYREAGVLEGRSS